MERQRISFAGFPDFINFTPTIHLISFSWPRRFYCALQSICDSVPSFVEINGLEHSPYVEDGGHKMPRSYSKRFVLPWLKSLFHETGSDDTDHNH